MRRNLSDQERATLDAAVEEFAASDLARQLQTPLEAEGRSKPAALGALGLLRERGLEADLVRLDRSNEHRLDRRRWRHGLRSFRPPVRARHGSLATTTAKKAPRVARGASCGCSAAFVAEPASFLGK